MIQIMRCYCYISGCDITDRIITCLLVRNSSEMSDMDLFWGGRRTDCSSQTSRKNPPQRIPKTMPPTTTLTIRASPGMTDSGELRAVLVHSLRSLFGDLQPHVFDIIQVSQIPLAEVAVATEEGSGSAASSSRAGKKAETRSPPADSEAVIRCPRESSEGIRAALTMCTVPNHLKWGGMYRFDVTSME